MPKLVAAAIAALAAALLLGAHPAAATTSCHLSAYEQQHLGVTYVLKVKVKKAGCAKAKKVVKAYHKCRHQAGGAKGKCTHKIAGGWKCTDKRFNQIPTQYDANATCKKGTARIWHTYTQNT
jgi:hypothetical protein